MQLKDVMKILLVELITEHRDILVVLPNKNVTQNQFIKKLGVYANKISIVYDLLIKGPNDIDYKNVSLDTEFIVYTSDVEIEYGDSQDIGKTKKLIVNNER